MTLYGSHAHYLVDLTLELKRLLRVAVQPTAELNGRYLGETDQVYGTKVVNGKDAVPQASYANRVLPPIQIGEDVGGIWEIRGGTQDRKISALMKPYPEISDIREIPAFFRILLAQHLDFAEFE